MADKIWLGTDGSSPTDFNTAANWSPSGVPGASDNVRFTAAYSNNCAGYDASGTALADVIVERGFSGELGSATADLQLACTYFDFSGEGVSYIDLGSSSVSPRIKTTAPGAGVGQYGLYLIGTGLSVLSVEGGSVGLAAIHGQASTCTTVRQLGGDLKVGAATVTNYEAHGGTAVVACNLTAAKLYGGSLETAEQMTIGTLTIENGTCLASSTGTITTANVHGGDLDMSGTGAARTVSTLNLNPGGGIKYDPASVTISAQASDAPITISTTGF